jgi:opacity protein-like surface antigen
MKNKEGAMRGTCVKWALAAFTALAATAAQAQLYGRVDVGFSSALDAGIRDKNFARDGFICADPGCNSGMELNDVGGSGVLSAGLGWRFSENFRADLTVGYRGGYQLDDNDRFPSNFKADITSTSVMLGAYLDFGTGGAKPYLGAGIGWAQNKIDEIVNSGFPGAGSAAIFLPGGTWSGMAWSLMAGVGIPLGARTTLDLYYRFIDLGEIESESGSLSCSFSCSGTYSGLRGELRAHEFMLGLRF